VTSSYRPGSTLSSSDASHRSRLVASHLAAAVVELWREDGVRRQACPSPSAFDPGAEVIGFFRYDDDSRLAEEWVQTDYRSFLTKLSVTTTESARPRDDHVASAD
jgi:hypothetical protein